MIGRNLRGESLNTATQDAIYEAEQQAFTPDVIKTGFRNTGVWPMEELFDAKQGSDKMRVSAINVKSKLFLGSEIHEAHVEAQKIKAEKEAKKAEAAKLKEEKKRKAVDDKLDSKRPRKKAKVVDEESDNQISFEISEDSLIECSGCDGLIDDYWTCPGTC